MKHFRRKKGPVKRTSLERGAFDSSVFDSSVFDVDRLVVYLKDGEAIEATALSVKVLAYWESKMNEMNLA